jgi:hypothetical protein
MRHLNRTIEAAGGFYSVHMLALYKMLSVSLLRGNMYEWENYGSSLHEVEVVANYRERQIEGSYWQCTQNPMLPSISATKEHSGRGSWRF